tara:strand:- start:52661 stop:55537 length:2877 start_codon:yes stop_codon:yes gene_type:complete
MRTLKSLFYLLFLISFSFSEVITESTAINIAENFFYSKNQRDLVDFNYNENILINYNNENIFYAIKLNPRGFILVAADDLIMPILGYSFENEFIISTTYPSNINYLFNLYSSELSNEKINNTQRDDVANQWDKYSNPVDFESQTRSVSPLLQARFNQDSSWNDMCPEDPDGPGGNVYVGCVAVAMAQIMHYWSYPEIGYSSHGYTHNQYGYQYANFGNSFYDYSEMANTYPTSESQELLYHCAVSVNMNFGIDGSGSQTSRARNALRNYFIFKNDIDEISASSYSSTQYRNILQNELNSNRPLYVDGCDTDGCHAWNIDGYDGDYFHNNFGWGGSQNGNYLLSSLNGFNYDQGALIGIEPQSLDNPNVVMQEYSYNEFQGDGDNVANPGEIIELYVTLENLIPWNDAENADIILSTNDESVTIVNEYLSFNNLDVGDSYTNNNSPFLISLADDITLSNHLLTLTVISTSSNGESSQNLYDININISLDQTGFPYTTTLIDDDGNPYNTVTTIKSSPTIIDINNDMISEIFFGDDNGFFHGVDNTGNALNGFPIELEGSSKEIWGSPAAADIDNDGEIEFIVTSKNKHCYIIDEYGNIELNYETDQYLMGTPSLANLDSDEDLEIIFTGYSNSGDVFAINYDGSDVNNFPVEINSKILSGVAIYDINSNGKDDIVVATENDKEIHIIYDNGSYETIFSSQDKFKAAPSILNNNNDITILIGNTDGLFYGINIDGSVKFIIPTLDDIKSEPGFITHNNQIKIFFGSEDGFLYGINSEGQNLPNWPQYIGNEKINSSPIFADLNNDNEPEVISATNEGKLIIFKIDGSEFENFPIQFNTGFESSPSVIDLDNDNDLEIIFGTNQNLSVIDIKNVTNTEEFYWNTYRGDNHKTGYYYSDSLLSGDLNSDTLLNVLDLVVAINIIISNSEPTSNQLLAGDLNNDNNFDVLDIVILVNLILSED